MPFVMTTPNDEVKVVFENNKETFTITIGAIPLEIGKKIDDCLMKAAYVFKSGITEEVTEEDIIKVNNQNNIASELLCKYGVRGHSGLNDAEGEAIPCIVDTEEDTGYKILNEKTLNIYLSNTQFLKPVTDKLIELRGGALAKYKVTRNLKDKEAKESEGKEDEKVEIPFTEELET